MPNDEILLSYTEHQVSTAGIKDQGIFFLHIYYVIILEVLVTSIIQEL